MGDMVSISISTIRWHSLYYYADLFPLLSDVRDSPAKDEVKIMPGNHSVDVLSERRIFAFLPFTLLL
jgi:hypothetical protein